MSHIKYTLIFDERVDDAELSQLFGGQPKNNNNQQLLEEIFEEEKNCEIVAKQDEAKEAAQQIELEDDV